MPYRIVGLKCDRNFSWVYKLKPRHSKSMTEYDQSYSTGGSNKSYQEEVWDILAEH